MSDHTTAVTGTRAHTLTPAPAATSVPHRNPVAHPWAAVYQPSHLLRGLSRFDPTSPLRTSRAAMQWVARIEWSPRQAVLRKFDDAASAQFWVYPSATVGEIEDFGEAAFVPFLRRSALIKEWAQLLEHARRVDACRETGRAWGYTC